MDKKKLGVTEHVCWAVSFKKYIAILECYVINRLHEEAKVERLSEC